ncbi:tumor necrosis factor receptor superfamily member 3 [Eucyclogobius newberryi]|uniref:tumor necrosis factor receptor superfamily member 3 n=1 Tax=Eucyclogobius newberryi TaxID=166745 RepID=UPI003B5ABAC6
MPEKNCTEESYPGRDGLCCRQCQAGSYKEKDCDRTTRETRCSPCERDHFTATRNHMRKCLVCKSCNINHKQKTLRACTAREDTVCQCVDGYYCSDSGCEHCRQVTLCPAGHGVTTQASRTNDIVCSPCEGGTFSGVSDHASPCRPHTRCEDGRELKSPGNATTDAVCGAVKISCPWALPAGLWVGLVLTSALVFALALFCWRSKRRSLYRPVNLRLPQAPVAVAPAADELTLPLPSKDLNGLYQEETYTPSYSCDLQVYTSGLYFRYTPSYSCDLQVYTSGLYFRYTPSYSCDLQVYTSGLYFRYTPSYSCDLQVYTSGLYFRYTPSYSCDLQVYTSDIVSGDGLDLGVSGGVPITPLKVSFLDSPSVNGDSEFRTANYERTISEPQEDEWCGS